MTNYDKLLQKQIIAFDLHKNQTYVNRLKKEGEILGYTKLKNFYKSVIEAKYIQKQETLKSFKSIENSLSKFDIKKTGPKVAKELYELYSVLLSKEIEAREELSVLKATENVFEQLNQDVEHSLTTLDILDELELAKEKNKYPPDVTARVEAGKCALKRPGGKQKFNCSEPIVEGTKYCKEHLKKYDVITYTNLFPKG